MLKVSDRKWSKFKINDVFNIVLASGDNQADRLAEGNIPLVSSGGMNNGVVKFILTGDKNTVMYKNVLTIDMFGKCFYHNYNFFAVSHGRVNLLYPKFDNKYINRFVLLFIALYLENTLMNRYSYNRMCSQSRLMRDYVLLPTKNNRIDFLFMEQFLKEREEKNRNEYIDYAKKKIDEIKSTVREYSGGGRD